MLKTAFSMLALAVLVTGVGMTSVDAKPKKRVAAAAGCTASMAMRDESRFWACYGQANKASVDAKPKKRVAAAAGCTASAYMRDESRFWACQPKK